MEAFAILYEDEDMLVANKLAPIPVQPEKSGDASLQDLLRKLLASRPGAHAAPFLEAAHRIDRRASGAVIFAKTQRALETLEADFRTRKVFKTYLACVDREPKPLEGKLEHRLVWDKRKNVVRAFPLEAPPAAPGAPPKKLSGERASLDYHLAGTSDRYWLLEIDLHTGRHHQIRAQLAAAGFPIRGDLKYGARRTTRNGLIMLHARRIAFTQPRTREEHEIIAPFPPDEGLWTAFSPGRPAAAGQAPLAPTPEEAQPWPETARE
jgi:23S rRNA pseudouridine1911/1915/1917 synthase